MSDERRRRLLGDDAVCTQCGCADLAALQRDREGAIICYECACKRDGRSTVERHHPIGRMLDETIEMPGNDHRCLSDAQRRWPAGVLTNDTHDPLMFAAGMVLALRDCATVLRGDADTPARRFMDWLATHADQLAGWLWLLQAKLSTALGPTWWRALKLPDLFRANPHGVAFDAAE